MNPAGKIALVNPNLMVQKEDLFTQSAVFMPISLAYFAAALKEQEFDFSLIDALGSAPNQWWDDKDFFYRGLTPKEIVAKIDPETKVAILYAMNLTSHRSTLQIVSEIRSNFPNIAIAILENTQAVTSYSLRGVQKEFYAAGADYVITGEPEIRGVSLIRNILEGNSEKIRSIDGIGTKEGVYTPPTQISDLDKLPFAAWEYFPLENYWNLRYSHGPQSGKKFFPILTSRGCPFTCKFCVIPETNNGKWRGRSPSHVVDEIAWLQKNFGVSEFHLEDVDPTVSDKRTRELCREIINRNINITWKLCSGTKVETLKDEETIELMARAGCKYISISPESGSPRVMQLMDKSFDYDHALKLIAKMNKCGIYTQCCFVLGFPGEEHEDRLLTEKMVHNFVKAGVDEVGFFIASPVPGSQIYESFENKPDNSRLNFSPSWRPDYAELNKFRLRLYRNFLKWKVIHHPFKMAKQPLNFLRRRYDTKMEMVPYRAFHTFLLTRGLTGKKMPSPF